MVVGPIAPQQDAGIKIDDVGLEAEAGMVFGAGALELVVAGEGEDVVAEEVGFAVVLMEAAVGGAIDDVAFGQNAAAAFIEIDAPTAVAEAGDVMPEIVANGSAGLFAQGIDAAHVAEDRAVAVGFDADMVDMVELDGVVAGAGVAVAPGPANRDAGVVEVMDQIMGQEVVRAIGQSRCQWRCGTSGRHRECGNS